MCIIHIHDIIHVNYFRCIFEQQKHWEIDNCTAYKLSHIDKLSVTKILTKHYFKKIYLSQAI